MLGFEGSASQPKIENRLISINTGVVGGKHPPLPLKSLVYNHLSYCIRNKTGKWEDGIEYAILACQAAEETGMTTEEEKEDQREYKRILKEKCYDEWKPEATDEEFEIWYQRVVLDGEDWEEE